MSSVEEVRQALALAGEKGQQVAAAVQQGVLDLEQVDALLVNAACGSANENFGRGALRFIEAQKLLKQAQGLLSEGDAELWEYVNRL